MKTKWMGVAGMMLMFVSPLFAKGPEGKERRGGQEMRLEQLTKKLTLTEKQQAEIKKILEAQKPKMEALKNEMKKLHESANAQIRTQLTEYQKGKFDEMTAKTKKRWEGGRKRKGEGRGSPERDEKEDDEDEKEEKR